MFKLNVLNEIDPVQKQAERGMEQDGISPMDPPDAFAPPGLVPVRPEDLHPFLRTLSDDHANLSHELDAIEEVLQSAKLNGFTMASDRAVMGFLQVLDRDFIPHSRKEEALLFPLLNRRLIADGEHSRGETITTAVDVMENEHLKAVQLAAVVLNLVRLATMLPDQKSALVVLNAGLRELANLVELLRLHMFREDNILFASANRLMSSSELDEMAAQTVSQHAAHAHSDDGHEHDHGHDHKH